LLDSRNKKPPFFAQTRREEYPLVSSDNILEPVVTEQDGSYAFALKWPSSEAKGILPEYYKAARPTNEANRGQRRATGD
jgi:hypothetical protein